jgi:hypothetical protein
LVFASPVVIGLNESFDLAVDLLDLTVEDIEDFLNALASELGRTRAETVDFHGSHGQQLAASKHKLLKFSLFLGGFLKRPGLHVASEQRQDFGVDAIGFGKASDAASEISNLAGIDDRDDQTGGEEIPGESSFESTGGFENDQAGSDLLQELDQSLNSGVVVIQGESLAMWQDTHIESVLADIDSNKGLEGGVDIIHDRAPVLPMRARVTERSRRLRRLFGLTVRNRRRSSFRTAS